MAHAKIEIGDPVRSFDFESRDLTGPGACYEEGIVLGIVEREGCDRYEINVTRRVWAGVDCGPVPEGGGLVYPPVNGTNKSVGGVCDGVVRIMPCSVGLARIYRSFVGSVAEAQLQATIGIGATVCYGDGQDWFVAVDEDDGTEHLFYREGVIRWPHEIHTHLDPNTAIGTEFECHNASIASTGTADPETGLKIAAALDACDEDGE